MAESSMDAFVYVIWAGTILCAILFTLKYGHRISRISNARIIGSNITISKYTLLQINATVIAGLLILVAIQSQQIGGLPSYFEMVIMSKQIEQYNHIINTNMTISNDTTTNEIFLKETKTRLAQTQLELGAYSTKVLYSIDIRIIQYVFNPITVLTASLGSFVLSCIIIIVSRNTNVRRRRWDAICTYFGFAIMGWAVILMMTFPTI